MLKKNVMKLFHPRALGTNADLSLIRHMCERGVGKQQKEKSHDEEVNDQNKSIEIPQARAGVFSMKCQHWRHEECKYSLRDHLHYSEGISSPSRSRSMTKCLFDRVSTVDIYILLGDTRRRTVNNFNGIRDGNAKSFYIKHLPAVNFPFYSWINNVDSSAVSTGVADDFWGFFSLQRSSRLSEFLLSNCSTPK